MVQLVELIELIELWPGFDSRLRHVDKIAFSKRLSRYVTSVRFGTYARGLVFKPLTSSELLVEHNTTHLSKQPSGHNTIIVKDIDKV